MEIFGGVQAGLQLVFWLAALAVQVFAFFDALSRPARYWQAADINRPQWLAMLGVAALFVFTFGLLSIFGLAAIIATIVYLVDRRPKLQSLRGTGGGGGFGGGGWRS